MKQSVRWIGILSLAGCGTVSQYEPPRPPPPSERVNQVWQWMTGSFSNTEQNRIDPDWQNMVLHMQPIWRDRTDGRWLYVEEAPQRTPDKPISQRVYRLTDHANGMVECSEFELPSDPLQYVGAWKLQNPLDQVLPSMLTPLSGCNMTLKSPSTGRWSGGSDGRNCASSLHGAAYATTEISLTANEIALWDRGFDGAGTQVWGSTKGPCQFKKQPQ